ncbi:hypothetical protein DOY81_004942 [Sarcophaga bullata]|nr:hypothetical protein DOY81_004942 [Sarcophaga bullata]
MYGSQNMGVKSSLQSNIINNNNKSNNNNNNNNSNNVKKAGRYGVGDINMTTTTGMNSGGNRIHANSQHLQQQLPYATSSTTTSSNNVSSVGGGGNDFMGAAAQPHQQQQRAANILCSGAAAKGSDFKVKPVNSLVVGQTHSVEGGSRAQTVENQSQALTFLQNQNNCRKNQAQQVIKTPEFLKLNEQFDSIHLNQQLQKQNGFNNRQQQQQQNFKNSNHCVDSQQQQLQPQRSHYLKPFQTNAIATTTTSDFNINTNNNKNCLESALNNNNNNNSSGSGSVLKTTTLNLPVTSYAATQHQQQQQQLQQYPVEQIYYSNNNTNNNDDYVYLFNSQDPYDENFDEDMEAERDLAEDAQWKKIQQNTFTRWANEHLKTIDRSINSLESDLSDGLRLIALIEVLSQKRMPKYNKRPTFRSQKLENVSVALKFLEDEGIKIVNIDSSDIVDCKLKLILGLIWTLILHYSISMPMWDGEDEKQLNGAGPTPKQRLLNWIHGKIPDMPINNFTNDWTSGKAVGALVDACAPGLCPDWDMWDPKDAVQNASEAMGLADDWLNVRQLIKPEELVNPNVDEQSMMTYLSQYPNAKLKQGAPLRPKTNPNRFWVLF